MSGDSERSSDAGPSDMSICSVSFAPLAVPRLDGMVPRNDAGAAVFVSTGCATMISLELLVARGLSIGIHRNVQHVKVDVDFYPQGNDFRNLQECLPDDRFW